MGRRGIPNFRELVEKAEELPNSLLERVMSENAKGGVQRFGVRVPVPVPIIDYLRIVLRDRNEEGEYVFESREERRRLRAIALFLPEEEGWEPTIICKETETWLKKMSKKKRRRNCFVVKADGSCRQYN